MKQQKNSKPATGARQVNKEKSRRQIIEATVSCIANHGLSGVTVTRICVLSGVSRGMINAHFISKDNLLLEVLRSISTDYIEAVEAAASQFPNDPARAFVAEIETEINFWKRSYEESCAWFAFRAESLSNPEYLPLCSPRESDLYAVPVRLCTELAEQGGYSKAQPELIARGLTAMLEGFWFDHVCNPNTFVPADAQQCCIDFLRGHFPNHFNAD
jgi:TetR/AcrR family transcriptional regulator, transcriptional repressor of bet genes